MPTRQRTSSLTPSSVASNLPPPRQSVSLKKVSPPLSGARFHHVLYTILVLSTLLTGYYSYRVIQWKTEVGGWWNLAVGKRPPQLHTEGQVPNYKPQKGWGGRKGKETVEDRINALADALGMPPRELASAIAGAVAQYVPPASLSSVASQETGVVVEELIKGASGDPKTNNAEKEESGAASGILGGVVSGMQGFVGMDEP